MSNLLIDIGNTLTKVAISTNNNIVEEFKFEEFNESELLIILKNHKINYSALSNVSKPNHDLERNLKNLTTFFSFTKNIKLPFNIDYDIDEVGDDRLALMCAACHEYPHENVLVIDLGTCITYDIKSNENNYNPGGISPGLNMRLNSIAKNAFNLSNIKPDYPKKIIAHDTKSSLDIGVVLGIQLEIEGFISKYKTIFPDLKVIITGGDAKVLSGKIKNTIFTHSNYTFKGLDYLIEYNK